jgi:hypothetical protein
MAGAGKPWGSTRLVLARQRRASEADILDAQDVGYLKTVGRPEEDPDQTGALPAPSREGP